MSREIKFRAWSKKLGRYIGGIAINQAGFLYGMDLGFEWTEENAEDYVIEQYTGLKDKNGKEIYEGDIVKMPDWQEKPKYEIVEYRKAGFNPFQEGCMECWSPDGDEVEVIGNIHENPELLGGEE